MPGGGALVRRHAPRQRRCASPTLEGGANVSALFYNHEEQSRALQHARHAEGAAHRVPDARACAAIPTWAACCARSPRTPRAGTTPSAALIDDAPDPSEVRRQALPGTPQRHAPQRPRRAAQGARQVGLGKRDLLAERQLLQQGHRGRGRQPRLSAAAMRSRATTSICASRWTCWLVLSTGAASARPSARLRCRRPVKLTAWRAGVAPARRLLAATSCAENQRGFVNTERYFAD